VSLKAVTNVCSQDVQCSEPIDEIFDEEGSVFGIRGVFIVTDDCHFNPHRFPPGEQHKVGGRSVQD